QTMKHNNPGSSPNRANNNNNNNGVNNIINNINNNDNNIDNNNNHSDSGYITNIHSSINNNNIINNNKKNTILPFTRFMGADQEPTNRLPMLSNLVTPPSSTRGGFAPGQFPFSVYSSSSSNSSSGGGNDVSRIPSSILRSPLPPPTSSISSNYHSSSSSSTSMNSPTSPRGYPSSSSNNNTISISGSGSSSSNNLTLNKPTLPHFQSAATSPKSPDTLESFSTSSTSTSTSLSSSASSLPFITNLKREDNNSNNNNNLTLPSFPYTSLHHSRELSPQQNSSPPDTNVNSDNDDPDSPELVYSNSVPGSNQKKRRPPRDSIVKKGTRVVTTSAKKKSRQMDPMSIKIGQHVNEPLSMRSTAPFPAFFIQNGNVPSIELFITGSFMNQLGEHGVAQNLTVIAMPKNSEDFDLTHNIANVSHTGLATFSGMSAHRLLDTKELVIEFILYDKSRGAPLKQLMTLDSTPMVCYNNTKDIPPPTVNKFYLESKDFEKNGMARVCIGADRLKWGSTNLLSLYIVSRHDHRVKKIVFQNEMYQGDKLKSMAHFELEPTYIDGNHMLYTSYTKKTEVERELLSRLGQKINFQDPSFSNPFPIPSINTLVNE
ncbi:hypothetical protein SAMD00019534_112120, partial [Acytostelium subglobosum LB1]|uniref:hypothetical protein n=1 Tax=Acytostelium subglobosum LB1 TaxID=1410327 RepID=UPI000645043A